MKEQEELSITWGERRPKLREWRRLISTLCRAGMKRCPEFSSKTEPNGPFYLLADRNFRNFGLSGKRPRPMSKEQAQIEIQH